MRTPGVACLHQMSTTAAAADPTASRCKSNTGGSPDDCIASSWGSASQPSWHNKSGNSTPGGIPGGIHGVNLGKNVCTVCLHTISSRRGGCAGGWRASTPTSTSTRTSTRTCKSPKSESSGGSDRGGTTVDYTLACGHRFHTPCIGRWLDQHSTCPTCGLLVAAVTRLVLSASQTRLPPSEPPSSPRPSIHAHAHAQTHAHALTAYDSLLYDAIGWLLVATLWVAVIAVGGLYI